MLRSASKAAIHNYLILQSVMNQHSASPALQLRASSNVQLELAVQDMTQLLIEFLKAKVINYLPVAA
jgi:hypothetical protein